MKMMVSRFIDHIYEGYTQADHRYCFILGAGASRSSGIRTGEQLMQEWFHYLMAENRGIDYIRECAQELNPKSWKTTYQRFFQPDY